MARYDWENIDVLVALGLAVEHPGGMYTITPAGVEAADMGEVDLIALHRAVAGVQAKHHDGHARPLASARKS